ncbi:MAG TPA: Gfo/Idh/MocA family oxidoreductase [Planctomycetota bacterium]|jgi:predicted dehydrogenase|nr:Gfo/Idh/MocA family oxidoreductase [Planctomycetota bacterium]OQC21664.1 MAG: 1,5-anhydro-D-fructose reductase [Planctomycetes bacterium ADurb.Bin069]NMD34987.1 Gfo/Idh/MocA family oxidoreductase [Planctomycetota bacterium]HNS00557.1 Gfo/Idh/MocA family oxidoreductase [Planctomycetota bacterium]HNU26461.1 Gfo/Idh/MocA family oxidoreductase [Planctomycetota bacterium]
MPSPTFSRRKFMGAAAAAPAFTVLPRRVLGGTVAAPSDKLCIAGIGVGGMGAANLANMASENIVALCDVDFEYAAPTFKRYPAAKRYKDYRVMLAEQADIDAVVIATPDHTHAVIAMAAMRAGKHVYCQKPLTHDVYEARALTLAAREAKVATQTGNQGMSGEPHRLICEWIWSGAIGAVREVDAWCSLSYYPWGHASWSAPAGVRPAETPAPPPGLDWDVWIGPAKMRPYHPIYHPRVWRCWWDFGSGMMGDRGAHTLGPVFAALKLGAPATVQAVSCGNSEEVHPLAAIVTYQFPARGALPPVTLNWYEGMRAPLPEGIDAADAVGDPEGGATFKGSEGMLTCGVYGNGARLLPEARMRESTPPPKTLPRVPDCHEMDWVRACKGGPPACSNFDISGPVAETCCLGGIAQRVEGRIAWDSANLKVTNNPEAQRWVRWEHREGWSL